MKRKLHLNSKQFIQTYSNDDIRDIETLKEKYRNEIAKVYEINTHGKFTVIIRSSFIRLHVYPTTTMDPCYLFDLSAICDQKQDRKRKTWKSFYGKVRKLIKNEVTSTMIIHSSTTQTRHLPIIIEQGHPSYGLFVFFLVICIMIVGFILWYIFMKISHSHKSSFRLASEDDDSDDQYQIQRFDNSETDLTSLQTNKTADSLLFDGINNTKDLERKSSENITFDSIGHPDEKINYENIQMLIENLQQSNLVSINSSVIGQILSDLIHQAIDVANNTNSNPHSSTDLQTFLLYAPQFFHILRTIITNKRSCESLNPTNFLQCQYLIDILHNSEFILEHLHKHHSHEREFLVKILSHLYQILASMNNNSSPHQSICQSLSDILEKLNEQKNSSRE